MYSHKLISLTASILLTSGSVFALTAVHNHAYQQQAAATIDNLPVTDLPGFTVYPTNVSVTTHDNVKTPVVAATKTRHARQPKASS